MILDKNLWLVKAADTPATVTKAVPLGQADLPVGAAGLGPYDNFWFVVKAGAAGAGSINVSLEDSDSKNGTYTTLLTVPTQAPFAKGDTIVKVPVPFKVKNWVRARLSTAVAVEAFFVYGVDKGVERND